MKKVMVVDDDKEFLEEAVELLKNSGYDTTAFLSGADALRGILSEKPDIILMDLKMEGGSGFLTAGKLKRSSETEHIPIIAITGVYIDKEHEAIIESYGFEKRLIKPVNPLDVIAAIELAVGA